MTERPGGVVHHSAVRVPLGAEPPGALDAQACEAAASRFLVALVGNGTAIDHA